MFSIQSAKAFSQKSLHPDLNPYNRTLRCDARTPIILAIDVTGSMGDWAKVIYDKLPMFFGQLSLQGYCEDPAVSVAAIGDAKSDKAPLQVTKFARGSELNSEICKVWLEGRGGGNSEESYDMACYYYLSRVTMPCCTSLPFLFITGDGDLYQTVNRRWIKTVIGGELPAGSDLTIAGGKTRGTADLTLDDLGACLRKKFRAFHLMKPVANRGQQSRERVRRNWETLVGKENVLYLDDPKACIDVILGAIATSQGKRTIDGYVMDLVGRGQDAHRQLVVANALCALEPSWPTDDFKIGDMVEIFGLLSDTGADLNGRKGTVTKVGQSGGRLEVHCESGDCANPVPKTINIKPSNLKKVPLSPSAGCGDRDGLAFQIGDVVEIRDLQSESGCKLNGHIGSVTDFVNGGERLQVLCQIESVGGSLQKIVNIRPANLAKLTARSTTHGEERQAETFQIGDVVEAISLDSESGKELNGKVGIVTQSVDGGARIEVQFEIGTLSQPAMRSCRLKPSNLKRCNVASSNIGSKQSGLVDELKKRLMREGLDIQDLPRSEHELIRNLTALGFTDPLDQTKLRKFLNSAWQK